MEEHQEEYDDQKMEELKEKYPNYEEMDIETLDSELPILGKDLLESETTEETQDINEEIDYVQELRRRKTLSEDLTREQLAEKFPGLSNLPYDDLMDRGDRLLNELILSDLDEDSFKEKSEELRYVRMLSNDYQRESNLNKLLNLRDKVKKRDLIKRDDRRRLQRLRLWARENAGILSAVIISSSAVIIGLVASTRNILWKVGDTTGKLDKRISELVNNQIELPPVFQKIADGVELAADNIWIIIVCAAVVLLLKSKDHGLYTPFSMNNNPMYILTLPQSDEIMTAQGGEAKGEVSRIKSMFFEEQSGMPSLTLPIEIYLVFNTSLHQRNDRKWSGCKEKSLRTVTFYNPSRRDMKYDFYTFKDDTIKTVEVHSKQLETEILTRPRELHQGQLPRGCGNTRSRFSSDLRHLTTFNQHQRETKKPEPKYIPETVEVTRKADASNKMISYLKEKKYIPDDPFKPKWGDVDEVVALGKRVDTIEELEAAVKKYVEWRIIRRRKNKPQKQAENFNTYSIGNGLADTGNT
ncbi:Hypothetical predicted protein [Paramuricea clavata]|uniref:Uncharacterized protein n=1 Tax=Paramuricea clavata TaxID=317549 RepID=A0A6S7FF20_PARCT|nr:Hypothetical predicted protein [Paramuricea clavata]